jgi:hypothetical protein
MTHVTHMQFGYGGLLHYEEHAKIKPAIESVRETIQHTFEYPERIEIDAIRYEGEYQYHD